MPKTKPAVPRRWNVEVDGIRWLPRMIDKARMRSDGTLGAYLLGHSPVDRALLGRLGLSTEEFATIVNASRDDEGVLAALRQRGFDEARVRGWSDAFPDIYATFIVMWDLDEGYTKPTRVQRGLITVFHAFEAPLMAAVRRVRKAP